MRTTTMIVMVSVLLLAASDQAMAYSDMLGVNLAANANDIALSTAAGYTPQVNWNNAQGGSVLTSTVTNNGINVPGLTCAIGWTWHDFSGQNNPFWDSYTGSGSSDLTKSGWNTDPFGGGGDVWMTVSGIPFASYDVAVLEGGFGYLGLAPHWTFYAGRTGSTFTDSHGDHGGAIYAMQILSKDTATRTISQVPAYNWYHGCDPTSAASILGYYDLHGFPQLFTASGWDAVRLTANVQDQISSPAHNAAYDPTPDAGSVLPQNYTSIADWMGTSVDPQGFGWTYTNRVANAFVGYTTFRGYRGAASARDVMFGADLTWYSLKSEIDADRPVLLQVDRNGDGTVDHAVTVVAYDDRGASGQFYGCYTTGAEDETVAWYRFRGVAEGDSWGVWSATFLQMTPVTGEPIWDYLPGDLNKDGQVGPEDFGILKDNFGNSDLAHGSHESWTLGDANDDGEIGPEDFGALKDYFGASGGPTGAYPLSNVPEPATISLLALGGLAILRKRRP